MESASAAAQTSFFGVVTRDPGLLRMFRIVEKAAQEPKVCCCEEKPEPEKELLASALHQLSPASGRFTR